MSDRQMSLFHNEARSEWVRLRTLIILRWLAVAGQTAAVCTAIFLLDVKLDVGLCALAIGASILLNLILSLILPTTKRLSEREAILMLLFDILQLAFLLYLTGGLDNPFSLLVLAPVTISATALTLRATIFLGIVAVCLVTFLLEFNISLQTGSGDVLALPGLFRIGNWIALILGIVFLAGYARRVTIETFSMSQALSATQMALEREHKLTALGGVVAAAAHEMGTPLATIKLVAAEMQEELKDDSDLFDDAKLIHEQADRLSRILKDMGRSGKDDLLTKSTPLLSLIEEAAEPHEDRGVNVMMFANSEPASIGLTISPLVDRQPQVIHGLRNLIQNAVDFATENVWIDAVWTEKSIRVIVADDGRGYPTDMLQKIGDPFLGNRSGQKKRARKKKRPEYEGMGLGLFIAKTLLTRAGASIVFANADTSSAQVDDPSKSPLIQNATGAIVSVTWEREKFERKSTALGENQQLEV